LSARHLKQLVDLWELQAAAALKSIRARENAPASSDQRDEEREQALLRFFAYQYCMAIGKMAEGLETLEALGNSTARGRSDLPRIPPLLMQRCSDEIREILETMFQVEAEFHQIFEAICAYRNLAAAGYAVDNLGLEGKIRQIGDRLLNLCAEMPLADRTDLRDSTRRLLSENWIYPKRDSNRLGLYSPIFKIGGIPQVGEDMRVAGLNEALKRFELGTELSGVVAEVLEGLASVLAEDGVGLGGLHPDHLGRRLGFPGIVGIIPGDGHGPCPVVLIAWGAGKGRYSPQKVWPKLQEAMILCGRQIEVAIFITNLDGGGKILSESLGIAAAHIKKGQIDAFLPVVVAGRKMTVLDWEV